MIRSGETTLAPISDNRSLLGEWRSALGRGLALWGSLGALAYRLILWQDTGEWLPVSLHTLFGLRIDLSWVGLHATAVWLTGLPIEAWTLAVGGLFLVLGRRARG